MKKRKALVLGSLGAALLLVGGTFAAYVVTDNANPFGIKISPSSLTEEKVGNITLEWGQSSVTNISNIKAGDRTKAGNVVLKASGKEYDDQNQESAVSSYDGRLTITLSDLTKHEENYKGPSLLDYLSVDVFVGNVVLEKASPEDPTPVADFETAYNESSAPNGFYAHLPLSVVAEGASKWTATVGATGTPTGSDYSVFVTLDNSVVPVFSQVNEDIVYLEFDWNKAAIDETTFTKTYAAIPSGWNADNMYAFVWKGDTVPNAWPGTKMSKVGDGLVSYDLPDGYTNIIFAECTENAGEYTTVHQTADLTIDADKHYFIVGTATDGKYGGEWSATAPEALAPYYVIGKINGQDNWFTSKGLQSTYAMKTTPAQDANIGDNLAVFRNLSLKANDEILVIKNDGVTYVKTDQNGNWFISEDGVYDVYVNKDSQLWVSKVTA